MLDRRLHPQVTLYPEAQFDGCERVDAKFGKLCILVEVGSRHAQGLRNAFEQIGTDRVNTFTRSCRFGPFGS